MDFYNINWRFFYEEKEELMLERGYKKVSPKDFYRDLFPEGSLQSEIGDGKGNIIATQVRPAGDERTKQWIINDSLNLLNKVIGDKFGLIPPIAFFGKSHSKVNAHELYAVAIDIDYVDTQRLKNLLKQFGNGIQLKPTYLVSSGRGVHVYYFLKEPIQLYHNRAETLNKLKEALIKRLWNDTSSLKPYEPDITGIYQGFRCVGSQSKLGAEYPVIAFKMSDNRYSLEDIKASIPDCKIDLSYIYKKPDKKKSKITLSEAKKKYPKWYQERIIEKKPNKKGLWINKEALYLWWKRKLISDVKVGGRYFSIIALCAYGLKCNIPDKQIKRDAYGFLEHLESLTDDKDNHFTKQDIADALKTLKSDNRLLATLTTREWLEKQTKVSIPPNKRNYRKQEQHLKLARGIRHLKAEMGENVSGGGRPKGSGTAEDIVKQWRTNNPEGRKVDCLRDTGLSKPTVYKWWNS